MLPPRTYSLPTKSEKLYTFSRKVRGKAPREARSKSYILQVEKAPREARRKGYIPQVEKVPREARRSQERKGASKSTVLMPFEVWSVLVSKVCSPPQAKFF